MTTHAHRAPSVARRAVILLGTMLLAAALLSAGGWSTPAFAAPLSQCNGIADDGDGVECDVTITNEWDMATSTGSSTVVTRVCVGAANVAFGPGDCAVTTVEHLDDVTTSVDQCNGTANGGGSTLRCTVTITNTLVGTGTTQAPSVNQCSNSFDSLLLPGDSSCDPVQATTNATIAQCNDSINGGTQVSMVCSVGVSAMSAAMPMSVDQCNGSVNGGGSLLECSTSITTIFIPAAGGGGSGGSGGGSGGGGAVAGSGDELAATGAFEQPFVALAGAIALLGAALLAASRALGRRRIPSGLTHRPTWPRCGCARR